jgi:hypothetical protein
MTASLSQFRADAPARTKKATREEWAFPVLSSLRYARVIAVDQSVTKTGLCALTFDGALTVVSAASFPIEPKFDGPNGVLLAGDELEERVAQHLWAYDPADGWVLVHESPPTGNNPLQRTESSWVGSANVRAAARRRGIPVAGIVGINHHKKITCGNGIAQKRAHHITLMEWASRMPVRNLAKVTNEGQRDALSVGITWLADKEKS